MINTDSLVVLGAGLAGCSAALELAQLGHNVTLIDRAQRPMLGASRHNEGKLHLGYIYAADPQQETHRTLASGSLRFLEMIERVTQVSRRSHIQSDTFTYIIPDDSVQSVDELWDYTQLVDAAVAEQCAFYGLRQLQASEKIREEELRHDYSESIQAAFRTPEIAVDPSRVSDIVSAAVYAHPLIDFRGACTVLGADVMPSGQYVLSLSQDGTTFSLIATGVINALWEDRVRIDEMIGIHSPFLWSKRWKATVTIDVPANKVQLPSSTAFVGPYGDFVLYGDRRIYVSWYPVCRLAMSTSATPVEIREEIESANHQELRQEALAGLASLMPGVASLDRYADTTRIGGGFIMAVGETDIDDPDSGLHERHQIGVDCLDTWISISTGKFCTAPMFGIEAANVLCDRLTQ